MSTQGSFIMIKDGVMKEIYIKSDARPENAGLDVIDLIKSTDLSVLFDIITEYDEFDDELMADAGNMEPCDFDLAEFKKAVRANKPVYTNPSERNFIQNSLRQSSSSVYSIPSTPAAPLFLTTCRYAALVFSLLSIFAQSF
jgi:hypothetical protein